jgi:hypothetical protein
MIRVSDFGKEIHWTIYKQRQGHRKTVGVATDLGVQRSRLGVHELARLARLEEDAVIVRPLSVVPRDRPLERVFVACVFQVAGGGDELELRHAAQRLQKVDKGEALVARKVLSRCIGSNKRQSSIVK